MRRARDPVELELALEKEPFRFDFLHTLRLLECLHPQKPRLGTAPRPADEPVRLAQEPSMAFAPSTLASFKRSGSGGPARLEVRFFGMLGPNGPLPLHLTEYARERLIHHGDSTFARFLDIFHHRFLELFYRAWAQAQPTVSLDRPAEDRYADYVGALFGIGSPAMRARDALPDHAKLYHAGLLSRHVRNADGLAALLTDYFGVSARIESWVGHWMRLPQKERTRLGSRSAGARLGTGAVLGRSVWDRQHKIRIHLGPLTLDQYETFLPGGRALPQLAAWVRHWLSFELDWDVQLVLARVKIPKTRLGRFGRLGYTTWLGNYARRGDAADLTLDVESRLRETERRSLPRHPLPAMETA